ncbi:hypothetical protein DTL42_19505 [Bremerella cremea]|uniref:Uncharacterized protein n=1 Tax=Bremerella cremea TaxID=1031537 RepID=A0A368KM05_9BACT|nr:hypothetical protein DTL42_19505 [Bremerella cremea]
MGDIREFWLALSIYVTSAITIYLIINMTGRLKLSPALQVVAILGGGIILFVAVIIVWAGVVKLFCKKRS